jgi:hypothetical protein
MNVIEIASFGRVHHVQSFDLIVNICDSAFVFNAQVEVLFKRRAQVLLPHRFASLFGVVSAS